MFHNVTCSSISNFQDIISSTSPRSLKLYFKPWLCNSFQMLLCFYKSPKMKSWHHTHAVLTSNKNTY